MASPQERKPAGPSGAKGSTRSPGLPPATAPMRKPGKKGPSPQSLQEMKKRGHRLRRTPERELCDQLQGLGLGSERTVEATGLVYDERMMQPYCLWDSNFPECPARLCAVKEKLTEYNLIDRCVLVPAREASEEEIQLVHSSQFLALMKSTQNMNEEELRGLSDRYDSVYLHPSSYFGSCLATGSVLQLVDKVLTGEIRNGLAVVRPPGHHAHVDQMNGYCMFNQLAIAARYAQRTHAVKRVLIVDWDVHHGQGTQFIFENDPSVLYFSIHRYENGSFWPHLSESSSSAVGKEHGAGFNINVAWNKTGMTDADYIAALLHLVLPVSYEFNPQLVLVAAGYDSVVGDPKGEMSASPACFAHLTHLLMSLAQGKLILSLEGGYNHRSMAEGVCASLKSLLGDPCPALSSPCIPSQSALDSISDTITAHSKFWKILQDQGKGDNTTELGSGGEPPTELGSSGEPPTELGSSGEPPTELGSGGEPPTELGSGGEPPTELESGGEPPTELGSGGEPPTELGSGGEPLTELGSGGEPLTELGSSGEPLTELGSGGEPLTELGSGGEPPTELGSGGETPTEVGNGGKHPADQQCCREPSTEPGSGGEPSTQPGSGGEPSTNPESEGALHTNVESVDHAMSEMDSSGDHITKINSIDVHLLESKREEDQSSDALLANLLDTVMQEVMRRVPEHRTGLVYDRRMMEHFNMWDSHHPELPQRIFRIFQRHEELGIIKRCTRLSGRPATQGELQMCHNISYIKKMEKTMHMKPRELHRLGSDYNSIYINDKSYSSACLAVGSVLNVVEAVMKGQVQNGVCIVRPPGHHAEPHVACGFCFFNTVSVAARYAQSLQSPSEPPLRVMILDWDVHHGNGTQHIFQEDPSVLYVSLHRYDDGVFFPSSEDAAHDQVGFGKGEGFNVNIPWNGGKMGDTDYLTAFYRVVMPIAYEFNPQLVLISAGFDAARGDPLGGYQVTPEGYAHMTHLLMGLAGGRVVLALEGGYNLTSISESMAMCTQTLLGDPPPFLAERRSLRPSALCTLQSVVRTQSKYWQSLRVKVAGPAMQRENATAHLSPHKNLVSKDRPAEESGFSPQQSVRLSPQGDTTPATEGDESIKCDKTAMPPNYSPWDLKYHKPELSSPESTPSRKVETSVSLAGEKEEETAETHLQQESIREGETAMGTLNKQHIIEGRTPESTTREGVFKGKETPKPSTYKGLVDEGLSLECPVFGPGVIISVTPEPSLHKGVLRERVSSEHTSHKEIPRELKTPELPLHEGLLREVKAPEPSPHEGLLSEVKTPERYPHEGLLSEVKTHERSSYEGMLSDRKTPERSPYEGMLSDRKTPRHFSQDMLLKDGRTPEFSAHKGILIDRKTPNCSPHEGLLSEVKTPEGSLHEGHLSEDITLDHSPGVRWETPPHLLQDTRETSPSDQLLDFNKLNLRDDLYTTSTNQEEETVPIGGARRKTFRSAGGEEKKEFVQRGDQSSKESEMYLSTDRELLSEAAGGCDNSTSHTLCQLFMDPLESSEAGFAVTPLSWCPHLESVQVVPPRGLDVTQPCAECSSQLENWVCLTCYQVMCGRYVSQHMMAHGITFGHNLVLSFSDLSVWCYGCEAYVHHEDLLQVKCLAYQAKFGEEMPAM